MFIGGDLIRKIKRTTLNKEARKLGGEKACLRTQQEHKKKKKKYAESTKMENINKIK